MTDSQNWIQIKVKCSSADLDTVCSVMGMVDNGLMIEDYSDLDEVMQGVYGDLLDEQLLRADRNTAYVSIFLPEMKSPAESIGFLRSRLEQLGVQAEITQEGIREEDWANTWKQYYKPIHTGERLVIVPVWETYTPEPGEIIVWMEPGMAFGTGTHETTRLCAALLESVCRPGCAVLDVGCGSGILAICAARMGAASCFACDIDPQAVRVAEENTRLNHTPQVTCKVSDLLAQAEPHEGGYDVICANIVADVIIRLAPDVGAFLAPHGVLIVSGIILERAAETVSALENAGFAVVDERRENGWYAAALRRKSEVHKN